MLCLFREVSFRPLRELLDEALVQLKLARGGASSSEIKKVTKMLEAAASEERHDLSTAFLCLILRDGLGEQQQNWKELGVRLGRGECDDEIHAFLNEAWQRFWDNPIEYSAWEDQRTKELWRSWEQLSPA